MTPMIFITSLTFAFGLRLSIIAIGIFSFSANFLTLVTLPAMIVCYNVGIAEFTMGHTELITTWPVKWSFLRFLLGSLGAWLLIALMVVIGIWFPARQAIKIQPAEALHEE